MDLIKRFDNCMLPRIPSLKTKLESFDFAMFWLCTLVALLFKSAIAVGVVNCTEYLKAAFWDFYNVVPTYNVYLAFLLIMLAFSFLLTGRFRLWFLIAVNISFSFMLLFDLWYFRAFGTFLSIHVLKQSANLENLAASILSMSREEDIRLFYDIPVLFAAAILVRNRQKQAGRNILIYFVLTIAAAGYLAYAHYEFDISPERGRKQYLFTMCWAPTQTITGLSPAGYHLFDAYSYITESRPFVLSDEDERDIAAWYTEKREGLPDNKYKGLFRGKNLIFIQVESLETFYLRHDLNGREITPNLNSLLNNSLYFSDFYEQVSNGTTADAEFMANTSVYPLRRGTAYFRYPDNTYNSLPKLLNRLGYSTLAIHPDNKAYWNWEHNMESIGYDTCLDASNFVIDERIGLGLSDGSFFRQVEPILADQKQPFLAFMITLSNHTTFGLPDKYKVLDLDKKFAGTMLGNSFNTVRYTDMQIGNFLAALDVDGLLDNTVVVIYGDHTGVHKFYADEVSNIKPAEDWWLDNHHHIPLIIYQKNLTGEEIKIKGGHIDILPTVAYLMGVDDSEYNRTAMGRNLLNTHKDFAVLIDGQYIGEAAEREKTSAVHGFEVADKIIRSSYFGKR